MKEKLIVKGRTAENPVENLNEFMEIFNQLKEEMIKDAEEINPIEKDLFLFRGMASDKFEIVGRIHLDIKNLREDLNTKNTLHKKDPVENVEKEILNNFIQRARIFQTIQPNDYWEWISLARHHGVPTRILDWSRDPQIALWFAVQDEKAFMHENSVFYIFYPSKSFKIQHGGKLFTTESDINKVYENNKYHDFESPFKIDEKKELILYRPSSLTLRIDYQSSWFTVHPFDRKEKGKPTGKYMTLQDSMKAKNLSQKGLQKIYISNNKTHFIRHELSKLGINTASIYKDLDSIGKYLKENRFRQVDEIFTDEMMRSDNILSTFQQLQGILGLYNSKQVKRINFVNIKGLYNQLISVLSNRDPQPIMLKTFNNMNREFLAYRNQRELFLRLIESNYQSDNFTYQRIQFYNLTTDYEREKSENKRIKLDDLGALRLFENIMVWTDGLSKSHVQSCENIKSLETTKYLLINDKLFNLCGFCIIKTTTQHYDKDSKKHENKYIYYMAIELNHDYLNGIIGEMQNMAFLLEFNECIETPDIIESYEKRFDEFFKQRVNSTGENWNYKLMNYNDAYDKIHKKRINLIKKLPSNYVMIKCYNWRPIKSDELIDIHKDIFKKDKTSVTGKWFRKENIELLVPVSTTNNKGRIECVHMLLDYIFYKVRWNHPLCVLREFSYGYEHDWYLREDGNNTPLVFRDILENIENQEMYKTTYKRYYYSEEIYQGGKIKPGNIYCFEYGTNFVNREIDLKKKSDMNSK